MVEGPYYKCIALSHCWLHGLSFNFLFAGNTRCWINRSAFRLYTCFFGVIFKHISSTRICVAVAVGGTRPLSRFELLRSGWWWIMKEECSRCACRTGHDNIQFRCVLIHWLLLLEKDRPNEENHLGFIFFFNMWRPPPVTLDGWLLS